MTRDLAGEHTVAKTRERLIAEGEALLRASEMPDAEHLEAMELSEPHARGLMSIMAMERLEDAGVASTKISAEDNAVISFDEQHLAKSSVELLPNYASAKIPEEKLTGYALNNDHPTGKYKALHLKKH